MTVPIKLIKLSTGDDLICGIKVNEEEQYATLYSPVRIKKNYDHSKGGAYETATFGPWESFSQDDVFHIDKKTIITLTEPREDVIVYYNDLVERLKSQPVDRMDDDLDTDNVSRLKKLKEVADDLVEKLGLDDDEEIEDYMFSRGKITKH